MNVLKFYQNDDELISKAVKTMIDLVEYIINLQCNEGKSHESYIFSGPDLKFKKQISHAILSDSNEEKILHSALIANGFIKMNRSGKKLSKKNTIVGSYFYNLRSNG